MSVYQKKLTFRFSIRGNDYELEPCDGGCFIEETRKNGQEDCHQNGELDLMADQWSWADGADSFDRYGNVGSVEILAFINANPPQEEDRIFLE